MPFWKVAISPKVENAIVKGKIHPIVIKRISNKVEFDEEKQRLNKTYNGIFNDDIGRLFIAYEFQEDNVLYIHEIRHSR